MYRIAARETELILVLQPARFASRLVSALRANRAGIARAAGFCALVPMPFLLPIFLADADLLPFSRALLAIMTIGCAACFGTIMGILVTVRGAIQRSPFEALLPRSLVMRADSLMVTPRTAPTEERTWDWIVRADVTRDGVDLVLTETPRVAIHVARVALSPDTWSTLQTWLRRWKKLPTTSG